MKKNPELFTVSSPSLHPYIVRYNNPLPATVYNRVPSENISLFRVRFLNVGYCVLLYDWNTHGFRDYFVKGEFYSVQEFVTKRKCIVP